MSFTLGSRKGRIRINFYNFNPKKIYLLDILQKMLFFTRSLTNIEIDLGVINGVFMSMF